MRSGAPNQSVPPKPPETPGLKIGSVVIDCIDFDRMLGFWRDALGYVPREPVGDDFAILRDPEGRKSSVSLNKAPERLRGRNWLHFDLYTEDQEVEVERLLKLGASRHRQSYDPEDDFVVLEDPDGNLFCVVDTARTQVPGGEVAKRVREGWELKATLADGSAIVGKPRKKGKTPGGRA